MSDEATPNIEPAATAEPVVTEPVVPAVEPAATAEPNPTEKPAEAGEPEGEEAKAAAKAAAEADPNAVKDDSTAPENYADFVMPEGVEVDETMLATAMPLFKDMNLSQENAQKLVDLYAGQMSGIATAQQESFSQLIETWQTDAKNDSEIGGEAFEENVAIAQQAINQFGDPDLKQLMDDYGVGNHPAMLRTFVKIGKLLNEDKPGSSSGGASSKPLSRSEQMYPTSK